MLPVYLSISGNFRIWQVKNIAACHWRQARTSLVIQNLLSWIIFSTRSRTHSCSSLSYRSYQTLLNQTWAIGCKLCSVDDKGNKINVTCFILPGDVAALVRSQMNALLPFESRIKQAAETMPPSHKTITAAATIIPVRFFRISSPMKRE